MPAVTDHAAKRRQPASAQHRGKTDQQRRHPRRHPVQQIVEPCRGASKRQIARIPVTDHAVRRVDKLVDHHARQAGHNEPHGWCDHPVRQVLGPGFDGGARNVAGVHRAGVAPDNHADGVARRLNAAVQRLCNGANMFVERPSRQQNCQNKTGQDRPTERQQDPGQAGDDA